MMIRRRRQLKMRRGYVKATTAELVVQPLIKPTRSRFVQNNYHIFMDIPKCSAFLQYKSNTPTQRFRRNRKCFPEASNVSVRSINVVAANDAVGSPAGIAEFYGARYGLRHCTKYSALRSGMAEQTPCRHHATSLPFKTLSIETIMNYPRTKYPRFPRTIMLRNPRSTSDVRAAVPHLYKVLQNATEEQRAALVKVLEEIARRLPEGASNKLGPKLVVSNNEPTFHDTLVNLRAMVGL
jgi:hypothetical protein